MEQCPRDTLYSPGRRSPAPAVGGGGQLHTAGLRNPVRAVGGGYRNLVATQRSGDCPQDHGCVLITIIPFLSTNLFY